MFRRENTLKKYLIKLMGTRWDVQSHEDQFSEAIPDLSYGFNKRNGWIELKQVESWPKKPDTPVRIKRYTPQQVNWLNNRQKKGGSCYILIKVEDDYFMFHATHGRDLRGGLTKAEYYTRSIVFWERSVDIEEFECVIGGKPYE